MNTSIFLSAVDQQCLRLIVESEINHPKPTSEQKSAMKEILSSAANSRITRERQSYIGFNDRVSLVSPLDSRDFFNLQIVMPADADADQDLISILLPISLALIGRRCGANVTWEGPRGMREMRIVAVTKCEKMAA